MYETFFKGYIHDTQTMLMKQHFSFCAILIYKSDSITLAYYYYYFLLLAVLRHLIFFFFFALLGYCRIHARL